MKAIRLWTMAMLCMTITMVSCSDGEDGTDGLPGADGAQGPQGADGADGADGISCWDLNGNGVADVEEDLNNDGNFDALDCQGADGVNGVDGIDGLDGNANVQRIDINMSGFGGSSYNFNLGLYFDLQELPNYVLFFYLTAGDLNVYPVPGRMAINLFYSRIFYELDTGFGTIYFYDNVAMEDTPYDVSLGHYINFTIIAIETTANTKSSKESVVSQLKAAGVDTNDYQAMVEYLGLK